MTRILDTDKLREVSINLINIGLAGYTINTPSGRLTAEESESRLQQLAADALVAELEKLRIDSEVTPNGAKYIRDRIAQLTAVPDLPSEQPCQHLHTYSMDSLPPQVHCVDCGANLPSEHETLRELGHE